MPAAGGDYGALANKYQLGGDAATSLKGLHQDLLNSPHDAKTEKALIDSVQKKLRVDTAEKAANVGRVQGDQEQGLAEGSQRAAAAAGTTVRQGASDSTFNSAAHQLSAVQMQKVLADQLFHGHSDKQMFSQMKAENGKATMTLTADAAKQLNALTGGHFQEHDQVTVGFGADGKIYSGPGFLGHEKEVNIVFKEIAYGKGCTVLRCSGRRA